MEATVIVAIIGVISLVVAGVVRLGEYYFKVKIEERKRKKKERDSVNILEIDFKIYSLLEKLIDQLPVDRITISRLHNGGVYFGGVPMEKFSISHEVINEMKTIELIGNRYQNTLISTFSIILLMKLLHSRDGFFKVCLSDKMKDVNYKRIMKSDGDKSRCLFLLKNGNQPIAFLTLHSIEEFDYEKLDSAKKDIIQENLFMLSKLLTITYENN